MGMHARPTVRLLPDQVANKIAAGEVVERPASVAKELIENAVDAEATRIEVEVAAGGRKLVAVRDNGAGMSRDDVLLSIERHATSKIRDVDDIENVHTLGFRGEALAAIASVCRFSLKSCPIGEMTGTEIRVSGGKLQDVRDVGGPPGTSVEVRDLFFNVPARRKFLRSHQTELSRLRESFVLAALAHPEIGMSLTVDGHVSSQLAAGSAFEDRLHDLFGADYSRQLCPVSYHGSEVGVEGFTSLPALNRADRQELFVFVNGRPTTAPVIAYAIREAYHTLLPKGRHPSVFLFLSVDPGLVDVNVHPTKREVRFRHSGEVRDTLIQALQKALEAVGQKPGGHAPLDAPSAGRAEAVSHATPDARLRIDNLPATRVFRYPRLPGTGTPDQAPSHSDAPLEAEKDFIDTSETVRTPAQEAAQTGGRPWSWCRVLGQVGSLYVVLETEDGLVLMDPHAAHERVLFENLMQAVNRGAVESQNLLLPETVELRPRDGARVRQHLDMLTSMGFGISEFGGDAFVVDALPACLSGASAQRILVEVVQALEQAGARGADKGRWREEAIAQAACKAAVKARDALQLEAIERLVVDLAGTDMPYTCPHGRPTLIFMSFRELNKKFARE